MYTNHLYSLNAGDKVLYQDLHGKGREITYVRDTGLVKAIKGEDYVLQQQFIDELGAVVHVPINAWKFLKSSPIIERSK